MKQQTLDIVVIILTIAIALIITSPIYIRLFLGAQVQPEALEMINSLSGSVIAIISIYVGNKTRDWFQKNNDKQDGDI